MIGGNYMDELAKIEQFKNDMQIVFDNAINKAIQRRDKPGNVIKPYEHFSQEHLFTRLCDEIQEYMETRKARELIDIINQSAFLYLRETIYNPKNLEAMREFEDARGR